MVEFGTNALLSLHRQANVRPQVLDQIHHRGADAGHAEDSRQEVTTTRHAALAI